MLQILTKDQDLSLLYHFVGKTMKKKKFCEENQTE
jgi:hypothetical protein